MPNPSDIGLGSLRYEESRAAALDRAISLILDLSITNAYRWGVPRSTDAFSD